MSEYGLIGKNLSHSFSKAYFEKKFKELGLDYLEYTNFELENIEDIKQVLARNPELRGFNVTIPYKENIIPFLDELSPEARGIAAVNCVKITNGKLIGYNTDAYGFASSIKPFLEPQHSRALILGTGGSSKAVVFVLKQLNVEVFFASTSKKRQGTFPYEALNERLFNACKFIINTTPVGMFPNINECPSIPYECFSPQHLVYDLIYNPEETLFLQKAKAQGATIINGLSMLHLQAEKSWEIWNF
ncbi:MAG: shikimate dehydrogenase [Bacteroidota bacterium]|nr:shikimate dehydrogenase [Bacteroidota bacterium]